MLAIELRQKEAIWELHARVRAARQAEARRVEEETETDAAREKEDKAAAALEQQMVALEEKTWTPRPPPSAEVRGPASFALGQQRRVSPFLFRGVLLFP